MLGAIARKFAKSERVKRFLRSMIDERLAAAGPRPMATYVGNNRVLVGTKVGDCPIAYYVEADDRLLVPWFITTGQFEPKLTDFFLRELRTESHCLDIGANFGFYSCLMAWHAHEGRVLGVEPDDRIADLAQDNLYINGLHDRAAIIRAAATDRTGDVTLYRRHSRSANTSIVDASDQLIAALSERPTEAFTVPGIRIDDLLDRMGGNVDLIKIDVEGAEPLALAGARETIRANRSIAIAMEWSPDQISAAGFDLHDFAQDIAGMGLRISLLDGGGERSIPASALPTLPYQTAIVLRRADALD